MAEAEKAKKPRKPRAKPAPASESASVKAAADAAKSAEKAANASTEALKEIKKMAEYQPRKRRAPRSAWPKRKRAAKGPTPPHLVEFQFKPGQARPSVKAYGTRPRTVTPFIQQHPRKKRQYRTMVVGPQGGYRSPHHYGIGGKAKWTDQQKAKTAMEQVISAIPGAGLVLVGAGATVHFLKGNVTVENFKNKFPGKGTGVALALGVVGGVLAQKYRSVIGLICSVAVGAYALLKFSTREAALPFIEDEIDSIPASGQDPALPASGVQEPGGPKSAAGQAQVGSKKEGIDLWVKGVADLKVGNLSDALVKLESAHEKLKEPAILFDIACVHDAGTRRLLASLTEGWFSTDQAKRDAITKAADLAQKAYAEFLATANPSELISGAELASKKGMALTNMTALRTMLDARLSGTELGATEMAGTALGATVYVEGDDDDEDEGVEGDEDDDEDDDPEDEGAVEQ